MRVRFYDYLAVWAEWIGYALSAPFMRLSRWAADRYFEAQGMPRGR